ncbi:MAG TPA: hypothetical protein VFI33_19770 [Puia sp.]|nr:hypothetical protein [Puia sp.]
MKNIKSLLFLIPALSFLIISCSKNPVSTSDKPILLLSKSTVKIGEPMCASLTGQANNTNVAWTSDSGAHIWPTSNTDSAIYIFTRPGTYTIKANFQSHINGSNDSTDGNVTVTDSIFSDSGAATCDVIAVKNLTPDDQINLTPVDYSDTGLVFVAHSTNLYNHSPLLNSNGNIQVSDRGFEVDISSALIFPCSGPASPAPAVGLVALTGLSNRTYTLTFKLNNITYSGSMTVTDSNIVFNWTYSYGVTISPLTIQRRTH